MRWYWTKIVIGALAIFCVGFGVLSAVRAARREVVHVVEGSGDLTVPVPFMPFVFDGSKVGNLRRLVIHRSSPKRLSGFDLTIRVSDPAVLTKLGEDCRLTVRDADRVGNQSIPFDTPFECVTAGGDYRDFGSVAIQVKGESGDWVTRVTVPLALPERVIRDLEGRNLPAQVAGSERERLRQLGDSLGQLGRAMAAASPSERAELQAQMEDLKAEMEDISQAMAEAITEQVTQRVQQRIQVKVSEAKGVTKAEATVVPTPPEPPTP